MSALTPEAERQVRAIVAEMIGRALNGADARLRAPALTEADENGRQQIVDAARGLVRTLDAIAIAEGRAPRCEEHVEPRECGGAPREDAPHATSPRVPKGVH
ncbi:hypothetical protein [Sphingomonas sp. GM_Shp_1]|uniref:hypothetical protein n=1 Tax=Sphingomonas sp. GM_Shp_1 TaxID=2937381 RepID=UPI00226B7C31|nr:hypothetical protein [Sphingomonas sp. GM_Shp_1]